MPALSLISRNSPKQLGMVSPELRGPRALPGADGGLEFREQVGERRLEMSRCNHGGEGPKDLVLFQRHLPGLFQESVHSSLYLGHVGLA